MAADDLHVGFKRYKSQKFIGQTAVNDPIYARNVFECVVEYEDGSVKTVYITEWVNNRRDYLGYVEFSKNCPKLDVDLRESNGLVAKIRGFIRWITSQLSSN